MTAAPEFRPDYTDSAGFDCLRLACRKFGHLGESHSGEFKTPGKKNLLLISLLRFLGRLDKNFMNLK